MSYTLRGRIESRLAALLPVVAAACALAAVEHRWWPVEAAALMIGIGLALDLQVYHVLLPYQPGWVSVPLGLLELGVLLALMRLAEIAAPLGQALALFGGGWLAAQLLGHAGFPLVRLSYAEDGGELGRVGLYAALGVGVVLAGAGATASRVLPDGVWRGRASPSRGLQIPAPAPPAHREDLRLRPAVGPRQVVDLAKRPPDPFG